MCQTASWFIRFRNLLAAKRITVLTSNTLRFCYSFLRITFSHFAISSVQFSRSVMFDSMLPHGLQHTGPPCISDSFVDHGGYSISSEGFLPAVVDIMVIWVKFTHFSSLIPTLKVRNGGGKEITLVQGKEQRLRFAGAAVKRYPMPKVRETRVRL